MKFTRTQLAILFMVLSVVVLAGCRRGREEEASEPVDEAAQTEERVNRFLEESGVELPEGSERANLASEDESDVTGVATRERGEDSNTITVLAALPDPETGSYHAWVVSGEDTYDYLGRLESAKGGYLIEKTVSQELSENEVVVSRETRVGDSPTTIVLRGTFN